MNRPTDRTLSVTRDRSNALALVAALCAFVLAGCSSSGLRVMTEPPGAKLIHVDSRLEWTTPCDVGPEVDVDDEVIISMSGYHDYRGTLEELPRVSQGTILCRLRAENSPQD